MLAGLAASVPFWNQSLFLGPVAKAHPEWGDLSFFVGFAVAALVHLALNLLLWLARVERGWNRLSFAKTSAPCGQAPGAPARRASAPKNRPRCTRATTPCGSRRLGGS